MSVHSENGGLRRKRGIGCEEIEILIGTFTHIDLCAFWLQVTIGVVVKISTVSTAIILRKAAAPSEFEIFRHQIFPAACMCAANGLPCKVGADARRQDNSGNTGGTLAWPCARWRHTATYIGENRYVPSLNRGCDLLVGHNLSLFCVANLVSRGVVVYTR